MPLQRAILAVQQISLLPLGQPFQVIVQFPARFRFFHNGLRLHGVGVGCGFDAPQLLFSRQNIVQRNTLVTDTILVLRYHPLFKSGKGIPNHIQQSSRVELGRKFEEGFYAKQESPSPQAVPAAGEPTISMTALLELLKNADPEVKAQLRLALLT